MSKFICIYKDHSCIPSVKRILLNTVSILENDDTVESF